MKRSRKDRALLGHALAPQRAAGSGMSFYAVEAFNLLRTNLLFTLGKGKNSILVTSAEPDAGKSVIAANLAISLAQTNASVLLIDADMRRCVQHRIFQRPNSVGLSMLLSDQGEAADMIQPHEELPNLHLLTAGPVPPNPVELLGSARMQELLRAFAKQYDYVVIDTPPVGLLSDPLLLVPQVAGAVLVARYRKTTYSMLQQAVEAIHSAQGSVLGIVLNQVEQKQNGFGQTKDYGLYSKYYEHAK